MLDLLGKGADVLGCFGIGGLDDDEFAFASGESGHVVEPDGAEIFHFFMEIAPDNFLEHLEQLLAFVCGGLVEDDVDAGIGSSSENGFCGGISVGDTGGIGACNQDDFVTEFEEAEDAVFEAGGAVKDQKIGGFAEVSELAEEEIELFGSRAHEGGDGTGTRDGLDASRGVGENFGQSFLLSDDVLEVEFGGDSEGDVQVSELEIGVEYGGFGPSFGEGGGEVCGEAGFSDSAFSTGDCDGEHVFLFVLKI